MQASIGVDVSLGSLPMTAVLSVANPNGVASPQEERANLLETPPSSIGGARRLAGGAMELHHPPNATRLVPETALCPPTPRSGNILHGHASSRKKPHLQGRFSGRLETKEDEKKLHDECRLLGPLVGGVGKRGEKSRTTLAKIVRAISAGDVRKHCEERESRNQEIEERMKALEVYYQREITLLKQENAALRMKLDIRGEEMVHRQVPSGHYSQEPLSSYGMDSSALPYLLPSGASPSAPVLQSQVSAALHSVPIQQSHAHLSIPSLPHHTMVANIQGSIIQEQAQSTKSMIQDDLQARSQMFHQSRDGILVDASLKRKRDEYGKGTHLGGSIVTMKPEVLTDDSPEIDVAGTTEEKCEKLAKHYHMNEQRKNSSADVVEALTAQTTDASDLKTSESSPFGGGRIQAPTSLPHQVLPSNGGEKRCAQGIGYSSEQSKGSIAYQTQKIGSRIEPGMYQAPVHQRNTSSGNGMSQSWIHQTAPLGTHYFVPEPDRYFQHISKEPLQQHNNILIGHAHGVQQNSTTSVHDPPANVPRPLGMDSHAPRVIDTQNGNDVQMSHGVMSLLHHGRRQVSGSHSTVSPPRTGISTESAHQM